MMLTTKSQYAVMAIVQIASGEHKDPVKLANISKLQDIPLNYLEQIFLKLKKANLVTSVKGPGGGYLLNANPHDISVESIVDAVEENLKMTRCSRDKNCRKNGVQCKTHELWKGLGAKIRQYFSSISIADIVSDNYSFGN